MPSAKIAVIGGSGLYDIEGMTDIEEIDINTPFGKPSNRYKHFNEWQRPGKPTEPETLSQEEQEEAKGKDEAQSPILTF